MTIWPTYLEYSATTSSLEPVQIDLRFALRGYLNANYRSCITMEIYTQSVTDSAGNAIQGASITVTDLLGNIVDIFTDREGTIAIEQPFSTDTSGTFLFAAPDGSYRITISGVSNGVPFEYSIPVTLFDPEDMSLFSSNPADVNKGVLWGDLFSVLNFVPPAGTGATGTWNISITGNAATADLANALNESLGYRMKMLGVGCPPPVREGEIYAKGNITAYYSDARLKDVEGKIQNALDKLLHLSGYYYRGNSLAGSLGYDTAKRQVGVLAQEVEEVLPEAVTEAPADKQYMTVWYEKLVPLLIEAVKELNDEVKTLRG